MICCRTNRTMSARPNPRSGSRQISKTIPNPADSTNDRWEHANSIQITVTAPTTATPALRTFSFVRRAHFRPEHWPCRVGAVSAQSWSGLVTSRIRPRIFGVRHQTAVPNNSGSAKELYLHRGAVLAQQFLRESSIAPPLACQLELGSGMLANA